MGVPEIEDEVFLNPPSDNKLYFFNLLRWCNIVLGFSLRLHRHFHAKLGKLMQRLLASTILNTTIFYQ